MTTVNAVWLGVVQGLTEFLPVSSSGHLVLLPRLLLGEQSPPLLFDVLVHFGTLVSALIYLRKDVRGTIAGLFRILRRPRDTKRLFREDTWVRMAVYVIVASLPTAAIGIAGNDFFEGLFAAPRAAAGAMLVTAALLLVTDRLLRRSRNAEEGEPQNGVIISAFLIGIAQGIAIVPGISRSGSTMCSGILLGLPRDFAFRFAFLLMIPAVLGATVFELRDASTMEWAPVYLCGVGAAFAAGILALIVLRSAVKRGRLWAFGVYCIAVGAWGLLCTS